MVAMVYSDGRRTYLTMDVVAGLMVVAVNASDGSSETRVSRRLGPLLSDKGGRSGAEVAASG